MSTPYRALVSWFPPPRPHFSAAAIGVATGLAVVSFAAFTADAVEVVDGNSAGFDRYLELDIHHHISAALHPLMLVVTTIAGPAGMTVIAVLLALLFFVVGLKWAAAMTVAAPGGGVVLEETLKFIFQRPRPHLWPGALVLHSYSFPSGHAIGSMALFSALTYIVWRRWGVSFGGLMLIISMLAVFVVGFSRVYLGAHWPTDIAGGWAVGLFWTSLLIVVAEQGARRLRHVPAAHEKSGTGSLPASEGRPEV